MLADELMFLHCFPQPKGRTWHKYKDEALNILKCIRTHGLLITDETQPFSDYKLNTDYVQQRVCFTLSSVNDLNRRKYHVKPHFERFGMFGIGIETQVGIRLGLLPALNLPVSNPNDRTEENLADLLLPALFKIQQLLVRLTYISNRSKLKVDRNTQRPNNQTLIDDYGLFSGRAEEELQPLLQSLANQLTPEHFDAFHDLGIDKVAELEKMLIASTLILNLYQSADLYKSDSDAPEEFYNYLSSEWRLTGERVNKLKIIRLGSPSALEPRRPQKARMSARELFPSLDDAKLDRCSLLKGDKDEKFIQHVKTIYCPSGCSSDVTKILDDEGIPIKKIHDTKSCNIKLFELR